MAQVSEIARKPSVFYRLPVFHQPGVRLPADVLFVCRPRLVLPAWCRHVPDLCSKRGVPIACEAGQEFRLVRSRPKKETHVRHGAHRVCKLHRNARGPYERDINRVLVSPSRGHVDDAGCDERPARALWT